MEVAFRPLARALAKPRCHRRRPRSRAFTTSRRLPREIQDAYILSAVRTPTGSFNGALASVAAPQLGAIAIRTAVERSNVPAEAITSVYMGNVLGAGMGQAPARQALIRSGVLSSSVEATTVNKVCSSGLKAVAVASQQIALGRESALVAGGMENMSQVPYYLPRGTQFPPFGEIRVKDGMISDGLWDPYNDIHMGSCAEATVKKHSLSREAQDQYAIESYKRATSAWQNGAFDDEVVPVTIPAKKKGNEGTVVREDEQYKKIKLEKIPTLKPAFEKDGSITAASSSSFTDGASALVVANRDVARSANASTSRVFARIVGTADAAVDPIDFPTAPAKAVDSALRSAGLGVGDISVWEINEAFAAVVIANAKMLGLDNSGGMQKINPLGGAIALGHAIGSSGSRILTTLLHQLAPGQFGCAAICNGGGGSSAMIVQRIDHI